MKARTLPETLCDLRRPDGVLSRGGRLMQSARLARVAVAFPRPDRAKIFSLGRDCSGSLSLPPGMIDAAVAAEV